MTKVGTAFLIVVLFSLAAAPLVSAQEEGLDLRLSRDWGYGGFGGDIQGTFSMKVTGPADLARVEFYIDDTRIGEVTSAPFRLQFVTDSYPLGAHALWALGHTTGGQELRSPSINVTFVSASAGTQAAMRIIVPLLVIIVGAMLLAALTSIVTGRKARRLPPGTPRQYRLGGGICPKCRRPFAFQLLALNLLAGKLVRCPYCGRWGVVRHASLAELRAAEQAELEAAKEPVREATGEDKLRKELDDSRYQDL